MLWHYTASHMVSLSLAIGLSFSRHARQKKCFIFLLRSRAWNEGYAKVCEDFKIIEEAPARALSWLKAPTIAFTFRTLIVVVGLLCNCDIFAKLRLTFVSNSTTEYGDRHISVFMRTKYTLGFRIRMFLHQSNIYNVGQFSQLVQKMKMLTINWHSLWKLCRLTITISWKELHHL